MFLVQGNDNFINDGGQDEAIGTASLDAQLQPNQVTNPIRMHVFEKKNILDQNYTTKVVYDDDHVTVLIAALPDAQTHFNQVTNPT